nr:hypothetical protein [Vibrio sp. A2-1]
MSKRTFVPLVLSFIANYAPYVEQGFNALQKSPKTLTGLSSVQL